MCTTVQIIFSGFNLLMPFAAFSDIVRSVFCVFVSFPFLANQIKVLNLG